MTTRRDFVNTTLVAGAAAMTMSERDLLRAAEGTGLKILILGGTNFLGPQIVDAAKKRGHTLTLFNRGKTHPERFQADETIEQIHGDRDGKIDGLKDRKWDAVVDTSGYVPRIVKMSANLLAPNVKQYVFISTISVYPNYPKPGMDESAPVATIDDPKNEEVMKNYGALKALCEKAAEASMPGRVTTIRPGLIVGPLDPTDRFTYWPVRLSKGGEVLAPGDGSDPTQVIDARDLGEFVIATIEKRTVGTFNATGPEKPMTMKEMLEGIKTGVKSEAKLVWAPVSFLDAQKVSAWQDMPAWVPASEEPGFGLLNCKKAIAAGLKFRPIADTAKDTLAWWNTLPEDRRSKLKAGITSEREAELLAALKKGTEPKG